MKLDKQIQSLFDWISSIDPHEAREYVQSLRAKHPDRSNGELAQLAARRFAWKGTASGALLGIPANPLIALPAAAADFVAVVKFEFDLAAKIATIYDFDFLLAPDARWELFVPIIGVDAFSQLLREDGELVGPQLTRVLARKYASKGLSKTLRKFVVKWFGKKVLQRAIISKSLPLVGAVIGGTWNHVSIRLAGRRIRAYLESLDGNTVSQPAGAPVS